MDIAQTQKSILVADDDPSVCSIVARALSAQGYRVRTASSGHEALMAVDHQHFDMMFLDIKMPGVSGLDVLRHVTNSHPDTVVVMLTGVIGDVSREVAHQLEAFAYLTKPCGLEEVTAAADRVLCACE